MEDINANKLLIIQGALVSTQRIRKVFQRVANCRRIRYGLIKLEFLVGVLTGKESKKKKKIESGSSP